jgi:hypothetical protein
VFFVRRFIGYKPMSIENIKMSDKNQNLGERQLDGVKLRLDEVVTDKLHIGRKPD